MPFGAAGIITYNRVCILIDGKKAKEITLLKWVKGFNLVYITCKGAAQRVISLFK